MKELAKERINHVLSLLHDLNTRLDEMIETDCKCVFTQWTSLEDACTLKGINYNTVKSTWWRQPKAGEPDEIINGRRYWTKETIEEWIQIGDRDLIKYVRRFKKEIPADARQLIISTCKNYGLTVSE
jgi:hypothetical protein